MGIPKCTVYRIFGLSIPIPNAFVATSTGTRLALKSAAFSRFCACHLSASRDAGGLPEYMVTSAPVACCTIRRGILHPVGTSLDRGNEYDTRSRFGARRPVELRPWQPEFTGQCVHYAPQCRRGFLDRGGAYDFKANFGTVERLGGGSTRPSGSCLIPKSASISLRTAREAVPVRARSGGGRNSRSAPSLLRLFARFRYAGRKSCPHSDTQCASSTTARLINAHSTSARSAVRN